MLEYGLGTRPSAWQPIQPPTTEPVVSGRLARWAVGTLEQGAYVLRLTGRALDGATFEEFTQISLEWIRPAAISPLGDGAERPDVSRHRVVWQAPRREAGVSRGEWERDVFLTDLRTGRTYAVADASGDQVQPRIDGRTVAWRDEQGDLERIDVHACHLAGRSPRCDETVVVEGAGAPDFAVAGRRVYWIESRAASLPDIHGCVFDRSGIHCTEQPVGLPPRRRTGVASDGLGLAWIEPEGGFRIGACRLDGRTGECRGEPVVFSALPISRPAVSADLVAWVDLVRFGLPPELRICRVDPQSGDCPIVVVEKGVADASPRLSGDRLVWDAHVGDQDADVFFCEYDRLRARCPVQRLTAEMSEQRHAAIDGDRVVWQDAREGETRIYGTRLPSLHGPTSRRARTGRLLRIPVYAHDPEGGPLVIAVEAVGVGSTEALGARLIAHGDRRATLLWRPAPDQAGEYVLTFSATAENGLVARRSVRIEVEPGSAVKERSRAPSGAGSPPARARSRDPRPTSFRDHDATAPRSGAP